LPGPKAAVRPPVFQKKHTAQQMDVISRAFQSNAGKSIEKMINDTTEDMAETAAD
jgi:hypothetical protein